MSANIGGREGGDQSPDSFNENSEYIHHLSRYIYHYTRQWFFFVQTYLAS